MCVEMRMCRRMRLVKDSHTQFLTRRRNRKSGFVDSAVTLTRYKRGKVCSQPITAIDRYQLSLFTNDSCHDILFIVITGQLSSVGNKSGYFFLRQVRIYPSLTINYTCSQIFRITNRSVNSCLSRLLLKFLIA